MCTCKSLFLSIFFTVQFLRTRSINSKYFSSEVSGSTGIGKKMDTASAHSNIKKYNNFSFVDRFHRHAQGKKYPVLDEAYLLYIFVVCLGILTINFIKEFRVIF